jgi:hypothetical protein
LKTDAVGAVDCVIVGGVGGFVGAGHIGVPPVLQRFHTSMGKSECRR